MHEFGLERSFARELVEMIHCEQNFDREMRRTGKLIKEA